MAKSPTTPSDPTIGFLDAIEKLGTPLDETYLILHGTTLGVNAIIQFKGATTGIIANEGLGDIFEIGRGDVPAESEYDYNYLKPQRLVKRRHVGGVNCRMNYRGEILKDLEEDDVKRVAKHLIEDYWRRVNSSFIPSLLQESDSRGANKENHRKALS